MGAKQVRNKELTDTKNASQRAERIEKILRAQFEPSMFRLSDDSARHAGHAGAQPGGETHYSLAMEANAFEGMSRVERQRAVMGALREEFETGLHALALDLKTPAESAQRS